MNISKCEICKRSKDEVSLLIQGDAGRCVCNECIRTYSKLLDDYSWTVSSLPQREFSVIKPHEIKVLLDKTIIGQEEAKIALSVAIYNHELFIAGKIDGIYKKSNILMIGPTGVGKTYLIENMARIIDVPLLICDATTYSEVGYVGDDVNHILELLYYQSGGDIKRAEKAIVFLDEIDKIGSSDALQSYGRDVSGAGVQQALLKMIEGKKVSFDVLTEKGQKQNIQMDTTNILFIFSGAFVGIDTSQPVSSALIDYGMLPEFIGRSYCIIRLEPLSKEDLVHIMTNVENSICNIYIKLFSVDGIEIQFEDDALQKVADMCIAKGLGARGLFAVMNDLLYKIRYDSIRNQVKHVVITESTIDFVLYQP